MLHTFLSKRQSNRYTIIKFCHSNNSNGKDLTVLFKMGLSQDIKIYIIRIFRQNGEIIKVYVAVTSQQVI